MNGTNTLSNMEEKLLAPYVYLQRHPGKEIRSLFLEAFNEWLDVPSSKLVCLCHIIGMLHTASLLMDDVEDQSVLRRGFPAAHLVYGSPITLNCANYVYFLAMKELQSNLYHEEAINILIDELCRLHQGQGMDIYYRDTHTCPSIEDYMTLVKNKTAGLFRLSVRLMLIFSPKKDDRQFSQLSADLIELAEELGVHFQIRDDYINLTSDEYTQAKSYCEDLTEGKFSYPLVVCFNEENQGSQHDELRNILRQRTNNILVKRHAVQLLECTGSLNKTRLMLHQLERNIYDRIDHLHGNVKLLDILKKLAVS